MIAKINIIICKPKLFSEGFAGFDDQYTSSPTMLQETEQLLRDQPAFCKVVKKRVQYEVKMWLMNSRDINDNDQSAVNLSVNDRLLQVGRCDLNRNTVNYGKFYCL